LQKCFLSFKRMFTLTVKIVISIFKQKKRAWLTSGGLLMLVTIVEPDDVIFVAMLGGRVMVMLRGLV